MVRNSELDTIRKKSWDMYYEGTATSPYDAEKTFRLLETNTWNVDVGFQQHSFDEPHSFRLLPQSVVHSMTPRTRIAYETIKHCFLEPVTNAFFGGRLVREKFTHPKRSFDTLLSQLKHSPLDHKINAQAIPPIKPELFMAQHAYSTQYPISATLDFLIGTGAGLAMAPVAGTLGLFYTPQKKKMPDKYL